MVFKFNKPRLLASSIHSVEYPSPLKIILLCLFNVSFIDSSGIGLLLGRYKQIKEHSGRIIICGLNNQIKKTIAISGIAMIIDTYEDIYENIKENIRVYE